MKQKIILKYLTCRPALKVVLNGAPHHEKFKKKAAHIPTLPLP